MGLDCRLGVEPGEEEIGQRMRYCRRAVLISANSVCAM
jgi:hypothetical protein